MQLMYQTRKTGSGHPVRKTALIATTGWQFDALKQTPRCLSHPYDTLTTGGQYRQTHKPALAHIFTAANPVWFLLR